MSSFRKFWHEIRRRKVLQLVGIYLVLTFLAIDGAELATALYDVERWVTVAIAGAALFALPFVVVLAWALEVTPKGIRRVKIMPDVDGPTEYGARRLEVVFALLLVIAVSWTFVRSQYLTPVEEDEIERYAVQIHMPVGSLK